MPNSCAIAQLSADRLQSAFTMAFSDCVGTYGGDGKMTLHELNEATGIKLRTLESYRDGETVPRAHGLLLIMEVLPERFTNRLLAEIGMGGAKRMAPEDIDLHMIASDSAFFTNMFVNHMSDGRIDHIEKEQEIAVLRKAADNLNKFLHRHDAANRDANHDAKDGHVFDLPKRAGA